MATKTIRTMKAPETFIKNKEEAEKIKNEIATLMEDEKMGEKVNRIIKIENEEERKAEKKYEISNMMKKALSLPGEKREKLNLLLDISSMTDKLVWKKFRLENFDNEFGTAKHLYYNEEKKEIEIVIEY